MENTIPAVIITSHRELPGMLRRIREQRDLALRDVAAKTGLAPSTISYYERNINVPPISKLESIVDALGFMMEIHLVPKPGV